MLYRTSLTKLLNSYWPNLQRANKTTVVNMDVIDRHAFINRGKNYYEFSTKLPQQKEVNIELRYPENFHLQEDMGSMTS